MPFPLALLFVALLSVAGIRAEVLTTIAHFDGTNGVMPTSSLSKGIDGNFYGVTDLGGQFGPGVVYRVTPGGVITAIAHFNEAESFSQDGAGSQLLAAQDGFLYLVADTGPNGDHVLYRLGLDGSKTALTVFPWDGSAGPNCFGRLLEGLDGNFFGFSGNGGGQNSSSESYGGTIYSFTPAGQAQRLFTFLSSIDLATYPPTLVGDTGLYPNNLIQAKDGRFYGTMEREPSFLAEDEWHGAIFRFTTNATNNALEILFRFNGTNGQTPNSLMQASDGNFYGTTYSGGSNYKPTNTGFGTVFKMTPEGQHTVLAEFNGTNGASPFTRGAYYTAESKALVEGPDGSLYGTTSGGEANLYYGTVFRITRDGALTTVADFSTNAGKYPKSGLVMGDDGNLYGTTAAGGTNTSYPTASILPGSGYGTVFRVSLNQTPTPTPTPSSSPAITSPASASGSVGKLFSYRIAASNKPTRYDASGLPAGLSINQTTGVISGKPSRAGRFNVTVSAANAGGRGSRALTLNVGKGTQLITFKLATTQQFRKGRSLTLTATSSSKLPVSFQSSNPRILSIKGNKATINGKGTVTITASQRGNLNYLPAKQVPRKVTIK